MDPVTLTVGLISAGATLAQGYSQKKQADYQASVYNAQADIYKDAAYRKRLETAINEDTQRRENRRDLARSVAAANEQGMINSQTTIGALGQYATDYERNALNIRYEGLSQANQLSNQANAYDYMGSYTKKQGKNAWNASLIKAPFAFAGGYATAGGTFAEGTLGNIGAGMSVINDIWDFVDTGDTSYIGSPKNQGVASKIKNRKWSFGG
jgi:hypothetical protein